MNWIEHNINKICRQNAGTATWWFTNERSSQDGKKISQESYSMKCACKLGCFNPNLGQI